MANLRLQGGKTDTYTTTYNNQIGPDTASLSIRTVAPVALTDLNCLWFDKTGDDGDAGTQAAPKLTCQAAIDAAVVAGGAFVYAACQDSGTYRENVNLKGIYVTCKDGFAPTIAPPTEAFSVLDDFGEATFCFIEWTISGTKYIMAGTENGVYRSSDGGVTFNAWVLAGKLILSMVLYDDNLYVSQNTDGYIVKVTNAGATSTFKDFSTEFSGDMYGLNVINDVFVCGFMNNVGYANLWYLNNSNDTWYALSDASGEELEVGDIVTNADLDTIGFVSGRITINGSLKTGIFKLISDGDIITSLSFVYAYQILASGFSRAYLKNKKMIVINSGNVFLNNDCFSNPSAFEKLPSSGISPSACYIDEYNSFYVGNATATIKKSINNGLTWSTITVAADTSVYSFITHKGKLLIADGWTNSTVYCDKTLVKDTTGGGTINGYYLDCEDTHYDCSVGDFGAFTIRWCELKNSIYYHYDTAANATSIYNSVLHASKYGVYKSGNTLNYDNNIMYDTDEQGLHLAGTLTIDADHNTFFDVGWPLYNEATLTITAFKNSILWRSINSDIYTASDITIGRTVYNYTSGTGAVTCADHYASNPIFISELTGSENFKLKSKAAGYPQNSVYCKDETYEADDDKDMGAWDITRTIASTAYSFDYWLRLNPDTVLTQIQPAHFGSGLSPDGVYSEWAQGFRRQLVLNWPTNFANAYWREQSHNLFYLYKQDNVVYRYGYTTDGTNWTPIKSGTGGVVVDSVITVSYNGEVWAPDQYAGWWLKISSTYYRIVSHAAKTENGTCAITLSSAPGNATVSWQIDFILVKIDKSSVFTQKAWKFDAGTDTTAVIHDYQLSLREVDAE